MPHQYLPETLALIEQARRDLGYDTDTTPADNQQLAGIVAAMQRSLLAGRPYAVHEAGDAWMVRDKDGNAKGWFADKAEAETSASKRNGHQVPEQAELVDTRDLDWSHGKYDQADVDEQWAGPSLPHPTEATSEAEADELTEGWDNWQRGLDGEAAEI